MTKSNESKTRSAAETRRLRLLSAVSLLSVSLGVTLDVTPAVAAGAGAPEANGQSLYLKVDGVKGEADFLKGGHSGSSQVKVNTDSVKGGSQSFKLGSSLQKGTTAIQDNSHPGGSQVKLDSKIQKGDMP